MHSKASLYRKLHENSSLLSPPSCSLPSLRAPARGDDYVTSLSTILTEMAHEIGGDHVTVVPLVKAGMDPHEYEPQPDDLGRPATPQLILATGKHLENYLPKLSESTGGKAAILQVGDAFPSLKITGEDAAKTGGLDPHWWHSIPNMKVAVKTVRDEFIKLDPADKEDFKKNAAATLAKLDALNQWARLEISKLPRDKRKLVTSHDAFQYFARDYGFTIYPIEGVTTEDEPTSSKKSRTSSIRSSRST